MNERETLKINRLGHLEIGGADTVDLAKEFGTPLYVFDEAHIRNMMRVYKTTIEKEYDGNGLVLYASKAFSCEAVYAIAREEGIWSRCRFRRRVLYGAKSGLSCGQGVYARQQ